MRTLKSTGQLHPLVEEVMRMNGDIIGVTQVRWSGKDHFTTTLFTTLGPRKVELPVLLSYLNPVITRQCLDTPSE